MHRSMLVTFVLLAVQSVKHNVFLCAACERPAIVRNALANDEPLYYFGLGSNMLRSKIENRGVNGTKIDVIEMVPASVSGYRLSFAMRGFPPLEPGMGTLEPVDSDTQALLAYDEPECHGALVKLTPENYEKVMRSEGISANSTMQGYKEVVVTAVPYDTSKAPVQAIALQAQSRQRLKKDPSPSKRYMKILREGAAELQLTPAYQDYLEKHPVQIVPNWLRTITIHNLLFTFSIGTILKWRGLSRLQSWLLFRVYVPGNARVVTRCVSNLAMALILLPGAAVGGSIRLLMRLTRKELPPMAKRMFAMLADPEPKSAATKTTPDID